MPREFFSTQSIFDETFADARPYASMPAMAGFFLATPGDLAGLHENAVRLFVFGALNLRLGAERPQLLTLAAFIFNESALWSAHQPIVRVGG